MLLSIITINFNNLEGLKKTAQSVLEQISQSFEWIVVDGDSTDGSKEYLQAILRNNTLILSEPDRGIYDAQNKGVGLSHGEYCLFLNSGDSFCNNEATALCLHQLEKNPACDFLRFAAILTKNNKTCGIYTPPHKISGIFLYESSIAHQATLIRKDLLVRLPYDISYKIAADADFFCKCFFRENVHDAYCELPLTYYDCSGVSSTEFTRTEEERKRLLLTTLGELIYQDYRRFSVGRTFLEHCVIRLQKNIVFKAISEIVILPIYACYGMISILCNIRYYWRKFIHFL